MIKLKSLISENQGFKHIMYHSTDKVFKRFDLNQSTQGLIWFTSDKNKILSGEISARRGYIITAEVTLKKPAGWDEYDEFSLGELKRDGYDGAILPDDKNTYDAFVFSPKQIKILKYEKL